MILARRASVPRRRGSGESQHTTSAGAPYLPRRDWTLAYSAFPCAVLPFTKQKPVMPSILRASANTSNHFLKPAGIAFLARAEAALLTSLPFEFFIKESLVRPPGVFSRKPRKTNALRILPRAIFLTFIAFIAFMLFIGAFMAFIAAAGFFASAIAAADRSTSRKAGPRLENK